MGKWKPKPTRSERLARTQNSMLKGTVGGRVAQAAQARVRRTAQTERPTSRHAVFSGVGASGITSPPYLVKARGHIAGVAVAGSGEYTAKVMVNGDEVVEIERDSNRVQYEHGLDIEVKQYDKITVELEDADDGEMFSVTVQLIELH